MLFLFVLLIALAVTTLILLGSVPRNTRAARSAIRTLKGQHAHLSPSSHPSYHTYGATSAAFGVALFGGAALYALDPGFAAEAEVQRNLASGSSSDGGGSSSDGGSSGGDSGGGGGCGGGGGAADEPARVRRRDRLAAGDLRFCRRAARTPLRRGRRRNGSGRRAGTGGADRTARARRGGRTARGAALLGGAEPVEPDRVTHLARVAELLDAPLVSEHIAFVRAGGVEAGHLLPVPRTRDAVDALVENITRTQAELPVPLALEPIAALFDWPDDELGEAEFLTEILDRTGALLLLDIANVYANARNRGTDPVDLLDRLPLDRVAYVHVAGGAEHDGIYHDTHTDPTPAPVLDLVGELCARHRPPALLLERDGRYPPAQALRDELDAIAAAAGYPAIT